MEACRKIFIEPNGINVTCLMCLTNEIMVSERHDLSWSQNFTSLQMDETCSSMVTKKKKTIRATVP